MVKFESSSTKVCGTSDVLHATTVLESGPTVQAMHRRSRLTLAACCGVHGVQDGLGATLYVLLPVLAQALGLSYAQVGVIRAANNAAMGMLEIPSGMLSERFGQRSLLVFGLLCAGFGYSALAGASTRSLLPSLVRRSELRGAARRSASTTPAATSASWPSRAASVSRSAWGSPGRVSPSDSA